MRNETRNVSDLYGRRWQSADNLRAAREGDDLKLLVRGTADAVTVKDHYAEGGAAQDWRIDFDGAN